MSNVAERSKGIWTIGHSTRSGELFGSLLEEFEIEEIIDVRAFPASRRFPQFNRETLRESLGTLGILYQHLPSLGGRRTPNPNSRNTAWRNPSFRAYADYMETEEFRAGVNKLLQLSTERSVAVMCAEALWWRCHRSLIADYMKSIGLRVVHIIGEGKNEEHPFTEAARIVDGKLSYRGMFDGPAN
jgi:uncharacterized protein (DUF488 family)